MIHWRREWQTLLLAIGFLTRIPVPNDPDFSEEKLNRACLYFPLVGLLLAAVGAGVFVIADQLFPSITVAVLLSMAATLFVSGGFHEDGLADCADGFGGGQTVDEVLRIMKDSRLGSFAVLTLFSVLAIKAASLVALAEAGKLVGALLFAHVLSRWFAISFMFDLVYVRSQGKAQPLARQMTRAEFLLAGLPVLPLFLFCSWASLLMLIVVLLVLKLAATLWLKRHLGGYTGDVLGGLQQLSELAVYLVLLAYI
jgi:adenosylcobinamide-GDP ribazoletransferase